MIYMYASYSFCSKFLNNHHSILNNNSHNNNDNYNTSYVLFDRNANT